MKTFFSHGKLLLTGEYVVLDGANALAVPTRFGQSLTIEINQKQTIKWTSLDHQGHIWFETEFEIRNDKLQDVIHNDHPISKRLLSILQAVKDLNPEFLKGTQGYECTTALGFPKDWGLGTSSTLINNIANWANVDAYKLLEATFGGSGYDIACANAAQSLTYQLASSNRHIEMVDFNPSFKEHLYFVYLNKKQNSRDGIQKYRANTSNLSSIISRITELTQAMIICNSLTMFQQLMNVHEELISTIIKQTPVKQQLFNGFNGSIKSLGAWGGDFVMAASKDNPTAYFKSKGFDIILPYTEMVLN
ncbi:GYDIA family GHMP kinase [Psychroserpens luteolus]|uniref:GYDIA family GHMP kinase n=1 Tax=Psychroserpens luteolus TaxID=2855840 RepID=UPI001E612EFC|nr:GYDIA family GHMP kinase [Psychroserpens luteolus]MCD2257696.1 GHMP kinase [Psychroserpens luteolus]